MGQYRGLCKGELELFESSLVSQSPFELGVLPSELGERDYRVGEIDNEALIKVCESKKGLDLL